MAIEARVAEINFKQLVHGRSFHRSPAAWEDEVLYFLMLDRFSDGSERGFLGNDGAMVNAGTTPAFSAADRESAVRTADDAARWREAGTRWCGGTFTGLAGQRTGGDIDTLVRQRVGRIPLGFMGDGRDTANAALFLASDEARFITGTEIVIDGGMTVRCD